MVRRPTHGGSCGPLVVGVVVLIALMLAAVALGSSTHRAESTSYCLSGRMADGSYVRAGSVASNRHPLGTRIQLVGVTFNGRRRFTVRDRIGHASELDLWSPSCAASIRWGRRAVRYRLGW